jgi:hypothetical protein
MMFAGPQKQLIMVVRDKARRGGHIAVCFGRKRHYRQDGSCVCLERLLKRMKPWYRARTRIDPWGGKR